MEISAKLVKELRDRTGAGMMECKKALTETNGNLAEAEIYLRKAGITKASSKATRTTRQGIIGSYIHPGSQLGVLVEVNCESDFVARTDDFQQLVKDVAMQVAAASPTYVAREAVPAAVVDAEREIYRSQMADQKKPAQVIDHLTKAFAHAKKELDTIDPATLLAKRSVFGQDRTAVETAMFVLGDMHEHRPTMRDYPLEVLADMAGLDVVRLANVFYVTTAANAEKLRKKKSEVGL